MWGMKYGPIGRLRDWLRGGSETVRRTGLLLREPLPPELDGRRPDGGAVTAAQAGVVVAVGSTLARSDRRYAAKLVKAQHALVAAAQRNRTAWQRLQSAADGSPASRHAATVGLERPERPPGALPDPPAERYDSPASPEHHRPAGDQPSRLANWWRHRSADRAATATSLRRDFDPHQHLIGPRKLVLMEAIFVVVEVAFWYGVLTGSIDRNTATVLDWIPPVLLAVFLPLAGIAAARITGQLGHRLVAGYPGVGPREWIGTVVALLTLFAAGWATYGLVHIRFAEARLGEVTLPAAFMAVIFVIVLVADAVARTFMRSELHEQRTARVAELDRLAGNAIVANAAHEQAWVRLRAMTQKQLDRCEQVVGIGAGLLADSLARRSDRVPVWVAVGQARDAHRPDPAEPDLAAAPDGLTSLAVPDPRQLELFGVPLAPVPLRVVSDAINSLDYWRPLTEIAIATELADLRRRWFGPAPTSGTEPGSATSGLLAEMSLGGRRPPAPPVPKQINNHRDRPAEPAPAAGPDGDT